MDRIDFEEWALKGLDPALAPRPFRRRQRPQESTVSSAVPSSEPSTSKAVNETVPLLYPPSLLEPSALVHHLSTLLENRGPHHRKRMWYCLIGTPFTLPFALVPVVPNLPLFFLLWRAWSHWRAWKASEYLVGLLEHHALEPQASAELDGAYLKADKGGVSDDGEAAATTTPEGKRLMLTPRKIERIVTIFQLGDRGKMELTRALHQAQARIKDENGDVKGDKAS
jgi:Mitochondrial K+-H+ exchange-related